MATASLQQQPIELYVDDPSYWLLFSPLMAFLVDIYISVVVRVASASFTSHKRRTKVTLPDKAFLRVATRVYRS